MSYESFLEAKATRAVPVGIAKPKKISHKLFPFQKDLVNWALKRGRAALFCDTGLGKSICQLEWSRHVTKHTGRRVLILAPLAVAAQTVREGAKFGIKVTLCKTADDVADGINVTNYDKLHLFDATQFGGVVLDESSVIKAHDGATRNALIEAFAATPFKLCCTATPSPNDYTELGNHSEFLGVMSRVEMLAQWFVHDGGSTQDWRLKGHARDDFWKWVTSWALLVKKPSDLGYDDGNFNLPELVMREHVVASNLEEARKAGFLFPTEAKGLQEQRAARRSTLDSRVAKCAELVAAEPSEPWLIWCELNDEGDALETSIPGAIQVAGKDSNEDKESRLLGFADGTHRILISKCSVAGYGLNLQICARVAFVGVSHSFEQFYQAIRRCWRFGQTRPVVCHIITSEAEGAVTANLKRKEKDAQAMADEMRAITQQMVADAIGATKRLTDSYNPKKSMTVPGWLRSGT